MIKKILISLLFVVSCNAEYIYTVDELIVEALKNSPDIEMSKLDFEASQQRYKQSFGGYLPKVDISANASHINEKDMPLFNKDAEANLVSGTLSANQLIYDFGKTSGNVGNTQELSKAYDAALKEQIIKKKRDIKITYYSILKNLALISVNEESIKLNESQLYRSKKYFLAGIRTKVDISDAQVRVLKAKISLKTSQYDLQNSYAALDRIVGFDDKHNRYKVYKPTVNLQKNLYKTLKIYDLDMDDAIEYAYKNRPELMEFRYRSKAQKELQKTASSRYYPNIYLNGNYNKISADKYSDILDKERWDAGIYLNWNLYTGGSDKAKIQEQEILTQKSNSLYQKKKLLIKEEVTKAYISVNKTRENVKLSQNLLELSKEKFNQITKQYEHGLSDYIQLQEARQGYVDAMAELVINYYNYYSAIAILDNSIGR